MRKRKSIKIKLIQFFLIMGITPSFLVMLIMYFGISSNFEKQTGYNLKMLALETSLRVDLFLKNKVKSVLKNASYSTLKRNYFPGSHENRTSEFVRLLRKFDQDLYNVALLDNDKKPQFSYRPNFFSHKMINEWWDKAETLLPEEVMMFFRIDPDRQKEKILEIIIPVHSDLNNKRLGFMITVFDFASLIKLIESIPITGKSYIALMDEKGQVLASTEKYQKNSKISQAMIQMLEKNNQGWVLEFDESLQGNSIIGFSKISVFSKNAMLGKYLNIFVSKNKKEAFQPILWLMIKLLAFCFGIVLIILIVFVFQIETIWKPILSLKKGAEMIGSGNFDMVLFIPTNDELEDLANSFNKMGKNLKISHQTLEEQNRKLVELNDIKNNFLSMVSHELRTPLMIIKEALSQILAGLKGPVNQDQKEFLNMAYRNTGRLNHIIQDLLSISKIETGKMTFFRNKVDLKALIQNEISNQKIKSDEKQIQVTKHCKEDKVEAYCDSEKLHIVFTNLLSNAIKFSKSNGQIKIYIDVLPAKIQVCVEDNGYGIPPESLTRIFERFVRLNPNPLIGASSSGLGLAIAKELMEMHHGKIWCESDGETGSKFYFSLPKYEKEKYLKEYFSDRITEATDRGLDLTVFNLQMTVINEKMKPEKMKLIFTDLKGMSLSNLFESLEMISLDKLFEIFIFSFCDADSAKVIRKKILEAIQHYLSQNKYEKEIQLNIVNATLKVNGNTKEELLKYIQNQKNR